MSIDRILAVLAALVAVRPIARGMLGSSGGPSWKRVLVLLVGGVGACVGLVGMLALRGVLLDDGLFYRPTALGATLALFGGMLGTAVLLASRGPEGMTEDAAIRHATLAAAMVLFVAAPRLALLGLGATRLLRAALPWTVSQARWPRMVEGVVLLGLAAVPRDATVGGLRVVLELP